FMDRRASNAGVPAVRVFRPLLGLGRADTELYCRENGIVPRQDSSKADEGLARNRLRRRDLPELAEINPRVAESVGRLADLAADDVALLDELIDAHWRAAASVVTGPDGYGEVSLARAPLAAASPALRRALLRRAYAAAAGSTEGLQAVHLAEMAGLVSAGAGRRLDLPGGIRFETRSESVLLAAGGGSCPYPPAVADTDLPIPGTALIAPGWEVVSVEMARPRCLDGGSGEGGPGWTAYADPGALGGRARVRSRRPGDRLQPLGMAGTRKLQDLFVDAGVPRAWRDRVPIVDTGRGIAWVAGVRLAEWARVAPDSERVVRLELRRREGAVPGGCPGPAPTGRGSVSGSA
ncbi:MAG: tRNA lysidine(34) synthetase TilS, partial [Dehalococcoidia bacterium]